MKRRNSFILKRIAGVPYLMTFGQAQADLLRGVKLNETGEYIWSLLENDHSRDELIAAVKEQYDISDDRLADVSSDLDGFLSELSMRGILDYGECDCGECDYGERDYGERDCHAPSIPVTYISIAGLNLCLYAPKDALHDSFKDFCIEKPSVVHQTITLKGVLPPVTVNGTLLLRNSELAVMECSDRFVLFFQSSPEITEVHMSKDGGTVTFYYDSMYAHGAAAGFATVGAGGFNDAAAGETAASLSSTAVSRFSDAFRENMFHAIRLVYLYLAMQNDMTVIHSASLLYRDRIWLFSGVSGTGKSTHTNLWKKLLGTPIINGDLNLIRMKDGKAVVCGIPWCGTSKTYDTETYTLGGIILLKQSPDNYTEELTTDRKILLISQRLITPAWTPAMLDMNLHISESLVSDILVCRLHCNISDDAVYTIKKRIDRYLLKRE